MTERALQVLASSGIGITHTDGTPLNNGNILNQAQWGNAFSWENPHNLAFTFPGATTTLTFTDADGYLVRDPISGSTVTDQQLAEPVTINGTTYTPNGQTTLWQTPPPVFLENVYEVTLVDAAGAAYRMVGIGITEGYATTVVGVAFDGPAPAPGTVLYYYQGNSTFVDSGQSLAVPDVVPCFLSGTLIGTPRGPCPIEDLSVGALVLTRDHGPQPIRWIGRSRVRASGSLAPIRFAAGALGNARDLFLSPNHRVLLRSAWAAAQFGCGEVLVAAKFLVDGAAIRPAPMAGADYLHLMLATHGIIYSEGLATESLLPGRMALRGLGPVARAEIRAILPETAAGDPLPCRLCLGRRDARRLLAREMPEGIVFAAAGAEPQMRLDA
jgi:hypothetical protein